MGLLTKLAALVVPNTARAAYLNEVLPGIGMTAARTQGLRSAISALASGDLVRDRYGRPGSSTSFRNGDGPRTWIDRDIATLRAEGRLIARNNPHARFAVRTLINWIIASGINLAPKGNNRATKRALETVIKKWLLTTQCDASRRHNFHGLCRLIYKTMLESGEVIVRIRPRFRRDGLALPMALQVMEPDFLYDGPTPAIVAGNSFANGIEFDAIGAPAAYWLYKSHPLDAGTLFTDIVRVPVYDDSGMQQIIHYFDKMRPDQHRGIPRGAIVVQTLLNKYDLDQSILKRKRVEAKIQHFLKIDASADPDDMPNRNSPTEVIDPETGDIVSAPVPVGLQEQWSWEQQQIFAQDIGDAILDDNTVVPLPPGYDYKESVIANFQDHPAFSKGLLREVAVGFFAPDWLVSGDLESLSFAGGELGLLSFKADCTSEQDDFIVSVVEVIWKAIVLTGNRAGLWKETEIECAFRADRFPSRDPGKDAQALIAKMNVGLLSRKKALLELGEDPDEINADIVEEMAWFKANGIPLGPGLYAKTASGSAAVQSQNGNDPGTGNDNDPNKDRAA